MKKLLLFNYFCFIVGSVLAQGPCAGIPSVAGSNFMQLDAATAPASSSGCIVLTPDQTNKRGCAWAINSTLNLTSNFSYDFKINLGSNAGGADGMAFVIQNDPKGRCACGAKGGSMGAGGITNSLIVEIDSYLNTEDRDDNLPGITCNTTITDEPHLDMWVNGNVNPASTGANCTPPGTRYITSAVALMNGTSFYQIKNGQYHLFRVAWNAASQVITASVMDLSGTTTYGSVSSNTINPITVFGTNTPYFGFTASTGGLSNQQSFCLPPELVVSISLISFNAQPSNQKIKIGWSTGSESNNDYFVVERSSNGVNYTSISPNIIGAGNSSTTIPYTYLDEHPLKGLNYYRLKQVDFDGVLKYSSIINASLKDDIAALGINAYPNPAETKLQISLKGATSNAHLQLYDITGRCIWQMDALQQHEITIDLENFPQGIYWLSANNDTEIVNQKVVINR